MQTKDNRKHKLSGLKRTISGFYRLLRKLQRITQKLNSRFEMLSKKLSADKPKKRTYRSKTARNPKIDPDE